VVGAVAAAAAAVGEAAGLVVDDAAPALVDGELPLEQPAVVAIANAARALAVTVRLLRMVISPQQDTCARAEDYSAAM
jgi:hypothetical protein